MELKKQKQILPWGIWLIIGLTILFGIGLIIAFFFTLQVGTVLGEKVSFTDLLMMIVSVISGFLGLIGGVVGVIGAYLLFLSQVKIDKENKDEEKQKELDYKKLMLFNLLDYTILKTEDAYGLLNHHYLEAIKRAEKNGIDIIKILSRYNTENYKVNKVLDNDAIAIYRSQVYYPEILEITNLLTTVYCDEIMSYTNFSEFVYDDKWTHYIDCIESLREENRHRDMQRIINWLTALSTNNEDGGFISTMDFILMRRGIRTLIDELYPSIRESGFRNPNYYI